jgi:trehalose-6-phosphate synthase
MALASAAQPHGVVYAAAVAHGAACLSCRWRAGVNRQFADAVCSEIREPNAIVLIQDYHFALLSQFLRQAQPQLLLAQFWHIPWPNRETFRICPWAERILEGLLGNDLLGFHIRYHCQNFLESVAASIEARVDHEDPAVTRADHVTLVRPFPISLDMGAVSEQAMSEETTSRMRRLRHQLGLMNQRVLLGVDRIDYTKGIPERLHAVDRLLANHPEHIGKVRFVQIGAPSRTRIASYQAIAREIESLVEDINWKYAQGRWSPIIYRDAPHTSEELPEIYYIGTHGLEVRLPSGEIQMAEGLDSVRSALGEIKQQLQQVVGKRPGILIEDKGPALACHYRHFGLESSGGIPVAVTRDVSETMP